MVLVIHPRVCFRERGVQRWWLATEIGRMEKVICRVTSRIEVQSREVPLKGCRSGARAMTAVLSRGYAR
jgi:hypothetical protein